MLHFYQLSVVCILRVITTSSHQLLQHPKRSVDICMNIKSLFGYRPPVNSAVCTQIQGLFRTPSPPQLDYALGNRPRTVLGSTRPRLDNSLVLGRIHWLLFGRDRGIATSIQKRQTNPARILREAPYPRPRPRQSQEHSASFPRAKDIEEKANTVGGTTGASIFRKQELGITNIPNRIGQIFKTSSASWVSRVSRRLDTPFRRQRDSQGC